MPVSGVVAVDGERELLPLGLAALVTIGPGIGRIVVAARIAQLHAGALAVRPARPPAAVVISHLIGRDHQNVNVAADRIHVFIRIRQPDTLAVIVQPAGVRPGKIRTNYKIVIHADEKIRILSHYHIRVRRHFRARVKLIIDAVRESPAGK